LRPYGPIYCGDILMKRIDEAVLNDILEGRTARKTNEKMGNREGGTNANLDGKPEDESEVEGEAELDAEDTELDDAVDIKAANKAGTKTASDEEEVQEDDSLKKRREAEDKILKGQKNKKDAEARAKSVRDVLNTKRDEDIEEEEKKEGEMTKFIKDVNRRNPGAWAKAWKDADDPEKVAAAKKKVKKADADQDARDAYLSGRSKKDPGGFGDPPRKGPLDKKKNEESMNEKSSAEGPKIGPKTPAEDTQDRIRKTRRPRRWSGKYDNEPRQNNLPFPSLTRTRRPTKPEPGKEDADEMSDPGKIDASKKNGDWIQKAVNPKHKGYCTPMTKDTCTPARKALAKRFKKAGRKEKKEGGTGWQGKV
jgi:hypothetical protein